MRTPLAWLNLWHSKTRTLVALAGVAFSSVLILMQLGFFTALQASATRLYTQLDFDLMLTAPSYRILSRANMFPTDRITESLGVAEIESATPLWVGLNGWLNMSKQGATRRGILVLGIRPGEQAFDNPEVNQQEAKLGRRRTVAIDRASRPEFGPRTPGTPAEVGGVRVEIVGQFLLGADFSADGAVITGEATFYELFPQFPRNHASLGLLRLREGASPEQVVERLHAMLPPDVHVRTRAQAMADEEYFWRTKTSIGTIFLLGVMIALIVGTAIVYQVLSSDIANRLPEFATLKAMGYSASYLTFSVLQQAGILAVFGFLPGLAISFGLYRLTELEAHIPMTLSPLIAVAVFLLCLGMCMISAVLSLRKVATADPADLF